ncbi:hypothetical protein WJX72_001173 [[Myrmecia] bisecta]|uniref:TPM domain-containing protein n=1 Tax=[Myrmecia] bisecta TaxID=41462 RepID=A0AAW1PZP5_9CHLO
MRKARSTVRPPTTATLAATSLSAAAAEQDTPAQLASDVPVLDLAKLVPAGQKAALMQQLRDLEKDTGWRLRLFTSNGPVSSPSVEDIRAAWHPDDNTVIVLADPTSPNILRFNTGINVQLQRLPRGFFIELQSRFGNMIYVREEGEATAVMNTMTTLTDCLRKDEGCPVVPGLPENQYALTLITSVVGGFVFGYASRLEPQGFVARKWVWLLLFAPLWGTLFLVFGVGPIVTRTADKLPLLGNLAGFLAAAGVFQLTPLFSKDAVDMPYSRRDDDDSR